MAISNYVELQNAMSNWLARDDLGERLPEFIVLFEAFINRKLLARPQVTTTTLTPVESTATLPEDFMTVRRVTLNSSPTRQLTYAVPDYFYACYCEETAEPPTLYTIEGNNLIVNSDADLP